MATEDGLASTTFTVSDNDLMLQDAKTALATLDPPKVLGNSAFGPLRLRAVLPDGVYGNWQPLATLVRLPVLKSFTCPGGPAPCTLTGDNLFLLDSVATDPKFTQPVQIPDGFAGNTLQVPPGGPQLYLKLRDDPSVVNTVNLPPSAVTNRPPQPPPAPRPAPTEKAAAVSAASAGPHR